MYVIIAINNLFIPQSYQNINKNIIQVKLSRLLRTLWASLLQTGWDEKLSDSVRRSHTRLAIVKTRNTEPGELAPQNAVSRFNPPLIGRICLTHNWHLHMRTDNFVKNLANSWYLLRFSPCFRCSHAWVWSDRIDRCVLDSRDRNSRAWFVLIT